MSRPLQLTSWQAELASRFPDLSAPVVAVLALYSFGMILAQVCGLTTVVLFLSKALAVPTAALRKRLREFYLDAADKSGVNQGQKRRDFDVSGCFAPLLRWVLGLWPGRHLALAIDVTNLGDRFHVLCVSVVVSGVGLPVAWAVLPGGQKEPWNPHWHRLLRLLKAAVPDGWTVIVLSDRGLESPDLFGWLVGLGWHPLMRVKKGGKFRPKGWQNFYYLHQLVRQVGGSFSAEGFAYSGREMPCTLLGCWQDGYAEPWLLLTDLPPQAGNAVWYGLRSWIEQGFKVIKGGGWDWDKTRMQDPSRVERLWLVLAVATLWVVALGADDEAEEKLSKGLKDLQRMMSETQEQLEARRQRQQQALAKQQAKHQQRQQQRQQRQQARQQAAQAKASAKTAKAKANTPTAEQRAYRVSLRGLAVLKAAWDRGQNPLPRRLYPQPWPPPGHLPAPLTELDFLSQQTYP